MIVDHGRWTAYTPADEPAELSAHHVMYAQRESPEAEDWYDYQKTFAAPSVVMTVQLFESVEVVQAATRDPSAIFPAGFRVIEETQYAGSDPLADFSQRIYDPNTQTIGDVYVPPASLVLRLNAIEARLTALEKGK